MTKQTLLSDIKGKQMKAIDVFSAAIQYLKNHLLEELKKRGMDRCEEDIRWVLTVPAIWNDPAKQFMRDAAEQVLVFNPESSLCVVYFLTNLNRVSLKDKITSSGV